MGTEDLEKKVEAAEREAMEAVGDFLNEGKNRSEYYSPVGTVNNMGHEWDPRTRECKHCGVTERSFKESPNPVSCTLKRPLDSHGNPSPSSDHGWAYGAPDLSWHS